MYEPPIKAFCTNMELQQEEAVFRAVRNLGFLVDKDELIRALLYDRDQYDKGYQDAMASIVRCRECKRNPDKDNWCNAFTMLVSENDFCCWGVKDDG